MKKNPKITQEMADVLAEAWRGFTYLAANNDDDPGYTQSLPPAIEDILDRFHGHADWRSE